MLLKSINLIITNKCNFKCKHCSIWNSKDRKNISLNDLKKFLESKTIIKSYSKYKKDFDIAIGGGEPFLSEDFDNLIDYIKVNFKEAKLTITTNGWFSEKIIRFLEKNRDRKIKLNISLDGPREIHDMIRGKPGSFEKVVKLVMKVKRNFPNTFIELKQTLMSHNFKNIIETKKIADKLNVSFSTKPIEYMKNYTNKIDTKQIIDQKNSPLFNFSNYERNIIRKQLFELSEVFVNEGKFLEAIYCKDIIFFIFNKNKPLKCQVLNKDLTILENGDCYYCIKADKVGNIKSNIKRVNTSSFFCEGCMLKCGYFKSYNKNVSRSNIHPIPQPKGRGTMGLTSRQISGNKNSNLEIKYSMSRQNPKQGMIFNNRQEFNKKYINKICNIEVTTRCNMNCDICSHKEIMRSNFQDLSFDSFAKIMKDESLINHVSFLGGEPLLNKDIIRMMEYLDKKKITYEITTNASMFTKKNISGLKNLAGIKNINISLDGQKEYHDKIRNKGSFQKAELAIKDLVNFFNITICSVYRSDNTYEIKKLIDKMSILGVNNFKIIYPMLIFNRSNNEHNEKLQIFEKRTLESKINLLDILKIKKTSKNKKIKISLEPKLLDKNPIVFFNFSKSKGSFDKYNVKCTQMESLRYDAYGNRVICEFVREKYSSSKIKKIRENPLKPCRTCCKLDLKS